MIIINKKVTAQQIIQLKEKYIISKSSIDNKEVVILRNK